VRPLPMDSRQCRQFLCVSHSGIGTADHDAQCPRGLLSAQSYSSYHSVENHAHMTFLDLNNEIGRGRMFHRLPCLRLKTCVVQNSFWASRVPQSPKVVGHLTELA